jgi:ribosomal protein S18 acetylase RimI-like enzyme
MEIRRALSSDRNRILEILKGVGNFTEEEVMVAMEVFDESCNGNEEYITLCMVDGDVVGYISFGWITLTESCYDLYWIAVDKSRQQRGYGDMLLDRMEQDVVAGGGDHIFVETSSEDNYIDSRRFYERRGYTKAAVIEDFYYKGNDKIIYEKKLMVP